MAGHRAHRVRDPAVEGGQLADERLRAIECADHFFCPSCLSSLTCLPFPPGQVSSVDLLGWAVFFSGPYFLGSPACFPPMGWSPLAASVTPRERRTTTSCLSKLRPRISISSG